MDTIRANESGAFELDTSELDGEYYILNSSDATTFEFEVAVQALEFNHENYIWVTDGKGTHITSLELDSNRGTSDIILKSAELNLLERIEGAEEHDEGVIVTDVHRIPINVSGITEAYTISGNVTDTTAEATQTIVPTHPTEIRYEAETKSYTLEDGGEYWNPHRLSHTNITSDESTLQIRENETKNLYTEISVNESGGVSFVADFEAGTYDVTDSDHILTFKLYEQTFDTELTDSVVTNNSDDPTTNLSITSNRESYDLVLWTENLTQEQLLLLFPEAEQFEGHVIVPGSGESETLEVNASNIPSGEYRLFVTGIDTASSETAILTVDSQNIEESPKEKPTETESEEPSTQTKEDDSSGTIGGGGGSGQNMGAARNYGRSSTETSTPTPTETPTQTETAKTDVPDETSDETETTMASTPEPTEVASLPATEEATGTPGQPGFGIRTMALTLFCFGLLGRRRLKNS